MYTAYNLSSAEGFQNDCHLTCIVLTLHQMVNFVLTKLKHLYVTRSNIDHMMISVVERDENIVGTGENA